MADSFDSENLTAAFKPTHPTGSSDTDTNTTDPLEMANSFLLDCPNETTPMDNTDAGANPVFGTDPNLKSDPNIISGVEFSETLHAAVDEKSNPEPVSGSDTNIIPEVEFDDASHATPVDEKSTPEPVPGSNPLMGSGDFIAADIEGDSNSTPVGKSSKVKRTKSSRKGAGGTPDWLPAGWKVIRNTRRNGATTGIVDTYYDDPAGHRYRSKVEVKRFLETGSKKKSQYDGNATPSESASSRNKQKSGTKRTKRICTEREKEAPLSETGTERETESPLNIETGTDEREKEAPWNFDFADTPEEVTWSLGDGSWKPSIGGVEVPEVTLQEWTATFERVCKMD